MRKSLRRFFGIVSIATILLGTINPTLAMENSTDENQTDYDFEYREVTDGVTTFAVVENPDGGPKISFSLDSGINILTEEVDGKTYYFKDLNNNNELDVFEDWRKDTETRAEALSQVISIEQVAGLMLFSGHESDQSAGLTETQKDYLKNDKLRNVLHAGPNNVVDSVRWTNQMQAFVESLGSEEEPVIPVNISSDPRSAAGETQYNAPGDDISRWPSNLGIAATFDPDVMRQFSMMSSQEYRALGITMALGPQIDLATEPRWIRVDGTFGEGSKLATDLAEAYVNYSQSTYDQDGNDLGWGKDSIVTMIKHFPGDGAGEGGRESHQFQGKYAVFPGDNYKEHLQVFDGGLNLSGKTEESAAVMTSYSIQLDGEGNPLFGESKGSAYNKQVIDLLRVNRDYDGVICTDWGVTSDGFIGMPWGAEDLTVEQRHFEIIKAGVDMFGGNNDADPVLAAYDMWQEAYERGELDQSADERFRTSAKRILRNFFNLGLFEDPYLDLKESEKIVASVDKVVAGYQAQLDSVVMLKNKNNTIKATDLSEWKDKVVYIPKSYRTPFGFFSPAEPTYNPTMDLDVAKEYFKEVLTDGDPIFDENGNFVGFEKPDITDVDIIIVGMTSPDNGGIFNNAGYDLEAEHYYPLSLQYRPYTADGENVRKVSISGDILEDGSKENRSYFGKTSQIANEYDLDAVLNAVELAEKTAEKTGKEIPVVVALKAKNPVVVSEFEEKVDAIVVGFQVSDNALFDIILGKHEPNGLLPMQFPKDMDTVEAQLEDVPHDMEPYIDSEGHIYEYGFGLNYSGVIKDERVEKYAKVIEHPGEKPDEEPSEDPGEEPGEDPGDDLDKDLGEKPGDDPGKGQDQDPVKDTSKVHDEKPVEDSGKKLPNTATPNYNFLIAGIVSIVIGISAWVYYRKRKFS